MTTDRIDELVARLTREQVLAVGRALGLDMQNRAADFDLPLNDDIARLVLRMRLGEIMGDPNASKLRP